jgi:hypothetical protein
MARWRQAVELAMTDEEIGRLTAIARSRSDAARRVQRAGYCSPTVRITRSGWAKTWPASSDGPTVRRAGDGLWPAGSTR